MKIRKSLAMAMCGSLLMLLAAGCGDQSGGAASATAGTGAGTSADSMKKIKARGELVLGVKFDTPPFGSIAQGKTEPEGFDIDLAAEVARRIGVRPKYVQVNSQNRVANLQSGKIDAIAASMIETRQRDTSVDFSVTYFEDDQRLMVRDDSKISGVNDLSGKVVALVQGANEENVLRKAAPAAKVLSFQSWPLALQALLRGDADAVTTTVGILSGLQETAASSGKKVKIVGAGFAKGPLAIAVRQGDSGLRDQINAALMGMVDDGSYDRIYKKWWSRVIPDPYKIQVIPTGS